MARGQLRAEAARRGIPTVDAIGRELSDGLQLQLELTDTPETFMIKRQLRTMNPQQRGAGPAHAAGAGRRGATHRRHAAGGTPAEGAATVGPKKNR